jgi:hypothetical protein
MRDREGGGSRGRLVAAFMLEGDGEPEWNPAGHATYCPQHYPCPEDAGGSTWLCCCAGPLVELRAAGQALIDAAAGEVRSNSWAEAVGVWEDIVAEQQRLEWEAEARDPDASCEEADLPADERRRLAVEEPT